MKKTAGGVLIACAVGLVIALCLQASGEIMVFTSRDEWTAANNGDVDFLELFNATNIELSPDVRKNIAFPGFSILQDPGFAINFAGSAELFASDSTPLFLAFNHSLFGFGADFEILEGTLELDTVGGLSERSLSPRTGFFGILSDHPFNAINFTSISLDLRIASVDEPVHFRLDNVSLAQVVPEPASLIIWGVGLSATAGYVAIRRRWRQQCGKV
jgi:hypothetical protein